MAGPFIGCKPHACLAYPQAIIASSCYCSRCGMTHTCSPAMNSYPPVRILLMQRSQITPELPATFTSLSLSFIASDVCLLFMDLSIGRILCILPSSLLHHPAHTTWVAAWFWALSALACSAMLRCAEMSLSCAKDAASPAASALLKGTCSTSLTCGMGPCCQGCTWSRQCIHIRPLLFTCKTAAACVV
jgi:hypothetical protein